MSKCSFSTTALKMFGSGLTCICFGKAGYLSRTATNLQVSASTCLRRTALAFTPSLHMRTRHSLTFLALLHRCKPNCIVLGGRLRQTTSARAVQICGLVVPNSTKPIVASLQLRSALPQSTAKNGQTRMRSRHRSLPRSQYADGEERAEA